jgi:hypothetical protein
VEVYNGDRLYYMCNRTEAEDIFPTSTSIVSSVSLPVSCRTGPVSFISTYHGEIIPSTYARLQVNCITIHSQFSLSYDRPIASSKASCPRCVI